jgi:hypothetical protein
MLVFIGFLLAIFIVYGFRDYWGRPLRLKWFLITIAVVSASFYSLRVIS